MGSMENAGSSFNDHVRNEVPSIGKFVKITHKQHADGYLDGHPNSPYWPYLFKQQGFYSVSLTQPQKSFSQMNSWCTKQFGEDHFFCTNFSEFWFETEQDAVWFALNWS